METETEPEYSEGDIVTDRESDEDDKLFVVKITDTPISEEEMYWDSSMNPTMVSDENPSYDPTQMTVKAVYLESFLERQRGLETYADAKASLERAKTLVDESKLKAYSFPRNRLAPTQTEETEP